MGNVDYVKKYMKISNIGIGNCHILDKTNNGYLIYSKENDAHYVVCDEIIDNYFFC